MADRLAAKSVNPLPGMLVRHPSQLDWGIGLVQSAISNHVTVSFEHAGKQVINSDVISLVAADTISQSS